MAQRTLMNREQLAQWILRELGAPLLTIELTADHLNDAIENAVRWFTARKGQSKGMFWSRGAAVTEFPLPDDVEMVLDVVFGSSTASVEDVLTAGFGYGYGPTDIYGGILVSSGGIPFGIGTFDRVGSDAIGPLAGFVQSMQYLKLISRTFSSDFDWYQIDRTLHLFPGNDTSGIVFIWYTTNNVTIEQLTEKDHDAVKRYALMRAKRTLGRIRSKYAAGFTTASGNVELDGATLLSEAKEEETELEEFIGNLGFPMGMIIG